MAEVLATIVRILNIISAIVLVVAGVWILVTITFNHFNIWALFTPFYLILYGLLLAAPELKQEKIYDYFGFLKTFLGRGLFYIFLAGVVSFVFFSAQDSHIASYIYGSILFGLGILYLLMNFYVIINSLNICLLAQGLNRRYEKGNNRYNFILISN